MLNFSYIDSNDARRIAMAYFPMFMKMDGLKVLVVGGGLIAAEKLEKLIDFTKEITVIAPQIEDMTKDIIRTQGLIYHQRVYKIGDINGFDIVIVATDTIDLHKQIYEESRDNRILVNSVDSIAYCDFIFPSYVKKEDLTIAFSTSGSSPAFAKKMRQHFEKIIPDTVGSFLQEMKTLRKTMPKGKERMSYFDAMVETYFKKNFKS